MKSLKTIKEKFSVPRRTKIIDAVLNYDIEETIQKESVIITGNSSRIYQKRCL